jgi:hypothetical protein
VILDVNVDVEVIDEGTKEGLVVVGTGGVEEGVASPVLGCSEGGMSVQEGEELRGVVGSEEEKVGCLLLGHCFDAGWARESEMGEDRGECDWRVGGFLAACFGELFLIVNQWYFHLNPDNCR